MRRYPDVGRRRTAHDRRVPIDRARGETGFDSGIPILRPRSVVEHPTADGCVAPYPNYLPRATSERRYAMATSAPTLLDTGAAIDDQAMAGLRADLRGGLLRPCDDGYDAARRVWNGMIDRRPALIARCAG